MRAKSHVAIGLSCAAVAVATGLFPLDYATFGGAFLGSLTPDLDHPKSAIGRFLPIVSVPLYASVGHRTATHSGFAIAIAATFTAWIFSAHPAATGAALAFLIGYSAHVAADVLCDTGVEAAWPFTRRRLGLWPHLRTNSITEIVAAFGLAAAITSFAYNIAPDRFNPAAYFAAHMMPLSATALRLPDLQN